MASHDLASGRRASSRKLTHALAVAVSIAFVVGTLVGAAKTVEAAQPDQHSLEELALASLRDSYRRLIDPTAASGRAAVGTTIPGGIIVTAEERVARIDARRATAMQTGAMFTNATVSLVDPVIERRGTSRVLRASEEVWLSYRVIDRAPRTDDRWAEAFTHEFTFELRNGTWELTFDRVMWPDSPAQPYDPDAPFIDPSRALTHQRPEQRGGPRPGMMRPVSAWGTFNTTAAVNYARQWWDGHNSFYPNYGANDCANFMSQTKAAGGWTAKGGFYLDPNVWWYDGNSMSHSNTWSLANWLLGFTTNSGRGYYLGTFTDLQVGDYLYADWANNGVSNTPEHSMIVTVKNSNSYWDIKLTYHSNPALDKPLQEIMNNNPGSVYWATRVPYTSN